MFLLRTAFWLSVVVLLLPADTGTGDKAPRVTAFEAMVAARAAVSDLSQFCVRNPDVCETGGTAFHVFADKVRYGAKMITGYFGNGGADHGPPTGADSSTLKPAGADPESRAMSPGDKSA
jgi:hypothetical protein